MIKAIIFDVGGTLMNVKIEDILNDLARSLTVDPNSLNSLYREYKKDISETMVFERISSKGFATLIKKTFDLYISIDQIISVWKDLYPKSFPINIELVKFADKLKSNYKVGIVSSAMDIHYQLLEKDIYSHFDPVVISGEVGFIKPQKQIFEIVLKKLSLRSYECVFIDDRTENLSVPKQMGFYIIHFQNNKQLFKELKKLGIN